MTRATLPSVAWFHPRFVARVLVAGSAAELWAASPQADAAVLRRLYRAGCRRLIICGAQPRFLGLAAVFPGEVEQCDEPAYLRLRDLREQTRQKGGVHGVLLQVYGLGVLLRGAAGAGKSELALELLARGHRLVADDYVELQSSPPYLLIGEAPAILRGFIEVRELGVLDVRALHGCAALTSRARIDLLFEFTARTAIRSADRLSGARRTCELGGVRLPALRLARGLGHNPAVMIEAACRDHWWRLAGRCAEAELAVRQTAKLRAADGRACN
ncbi:MAG: hypothetical protein KGJ55_07525 [Gammaproteobacteria bacterium]|nr:hypothetical protein [Gammaproteobacteria bacterium]